MPQAGSDNDGVPEDEDAGPAPLSSDDRAVMAANIASYMSGEVVADWRAAGNAWRCRDCGHTIDDKSGVTITERSTGEAPGRVYALCGACRAIPPKAR